MGVVIVVVAPLGAEVGLSLYNGVMVEDERR